MVLVLYEASMKPATTMLTFLYQITTLFCVLMVVWTLFVPGSWMFGRSNFHDEVAGWYLNYLEGRGLVPTEFFTKYQGHTAIHLTHLLPSAVWSAIIPFQLHSTFRCHHPKIHRCMGYIFFVSAMLMAVGLGIILQRGMLFENSFPDLPPPTVSMKPMVIVDMMYFVVSACYALRLALKRQFRRHQRWMIRHIASGLFIAWQRILIAVLFGPLHPPPVSRETQRSVFGQAGFLGLVISLSCGEYAIHLLDLEHQRMTAKAR